MLGVVPVDRKKTYDMRHIIHLVLDQFRLVNLTFYHTPATGESQRLSRGLFIALQAPSDGSYG